MSIIAVFGAQHGSSAAQTLGRHTMLGVIPGPALDDGHCIGKGSVLNSYRTGGQ